MHLGRVCFWHQQNIMGACGRQKLLTAAQTLDHITWLLHNVPSLTKSWRACRARIWGSAGMPRALMADKDCWLQLMSLDPVTGLDPEGTRLRAHEGLDGVDFFVPVRALCRKGPGTHHGVLGFQGALARGPGRRGLLCPSANLMQDELCSAREQGQGRMCADGGSRGFISAYRQSTGVRTRHGAGPRGHAPARARGPGRRGLLCAGRRTIVQQGLLALLDEYTGTGHALFCPALGKWL